MTNRQKVLTSVLLAKMHLNFYHDVLNENTEDMQHVVKALSCKDTLTHLDNAILEVIYKLSNDQIVAVYNKINSLKFEGINLAEMLAITILEVDFSLDKLTRLKNPSAKDNSAIWRLKLVLGKLHKRSTQMFNKGMFIDNDECELATQVRNNLWSQL